MGLSLSELTAQTTAPPIAADVYGDMLASIGKQVQEAEVQQPDVAEDVPTVGDAVDEPLGETGPELVESYMEPPAQVVETKRCAIATEDLSSATVALLKRDPSAKQHAIKAVEWACKHLPGKCGYTLTVNMPIGSMDFPVIDWKEDQTLLTIILPEESMTFRPAYGVDLDLTLSDADGKGKSFDVVYGGGTLNVDGLAVVIMSFLIHNNIHGEER